MPRSTFDRRRLRSRDQLGAIADRVRRWAEAADDVDGLDLAASLEHAADSEQPGAAFARRFGLPRYRQSPAKAERDKAYAELVAARRYDGMSAEHRCRKVVEDLATYAAGAAWRADRQRCDCPYPAASWHAGAWRALMVDARIPNPKTVRRACTRQGQNSFVPASMPVSQSTTTSPEHSAE